MQARRYALGNSESAAAVERILRHIVHPYAIDKLLVFPPLEAWVAVAYGSLDRKAAISGTRFYMCGIDIRSVNRLAASALACIREFFAAHKFAVGIEEQ